MTACAPIPTALLDALLVTAGASTGQSVAPGGKAISSPITGGKAAFTELLGSLLEADQEPDADQGGAQTVPWAALLFSEPLSRSLPFSAGLDPFSAAADAFAVHADPSAGAENLAPALAFGNSTTSPVSPRGGARLQAHDSGKDASAVPLRASPDGLPDVSFVANLFFLPDPSHAVANATPPDANLPPSPIPFGGAESATPRVSAATSGGLPSPGDAANGRKAAAPALSARPRVSAGVAHLEAASFLSPIGRASPADPVKTSPVLSGSGTDIRVAGDTNVAAFPMRADDPAVSPLPPNSSRQSPVAFRARLIPQEQVADLPAGPETPNPAIDATASRSDLYRAPGNAGELPAEASTQPLGVLPRAKEEEPHPAADRSDPAAAVLVKPAGLETPAVEQRGVDLKTVRGLAEQHPARAESEPHTEPLRNAEPARDIRLQVSAGEQRVEVRVSERGGDIQLAVRTPDSRLAGNLRENLPALSARLEQSGFRAETWDPGTSLQEHRWRPADTAAASSSETGQHGAWQGPHDQGHGSWREPKPAPEQAPTQRRKEFAWLLSSLG